MGSRIVIPLVGVWGQGGRSYYSVFFIRCTMSLSVNLFGYDFGSSISWNLCYATIYGLPAWVWQCTSPLIWFGGRGFS